MSLSSILAVIVLYEEEFVKSKTFLSLVSALNITEDFLEILLYDNSRIPQYENEIFEIDRLKIHYIHNANNPGIGVAYNKGATLAKKLNKEWVLLLDQDTKLPNSIFFSYLRGIKEYPNIKLFAPLLKLKDGTIFSPVKYMFSRGFHVKKVTFGINSLKRLSPVNSGMLVNLNAFIEAGGYNEKIKLDFADFQFIEKLRKNSNQFLLINSICMQDFSNESDDINKLEIRYEIYCNDTKNCNPDTLFGSSLYFIHALVRAIKLVLKTKKSSFIKIWLKYYIN